MTQYIKHLGLALAFSLFPFRGWAQFEGMQLSPQAKISLITCSSGNELYSVFGHSAVRVLDPASGLDIIFNYGTFDFDEPNFYLKFARGKLNYKLSAAYFHDFVTNYIAENRSVYEQELNLTDEQRQQYWQFLTNNYLPANRFYLYDFFFDNCATRIRDGLEASFPGNIAFHISQFDKDMSFRNLIGLYLEAQPWGDFGIDLALGAPIDREAAPYEYMFLPDFLSKGFANATIGEGGRTVPLVKERQVIFERDQTLLDKDTYQTPVALGWLLLAAALILTILNFRNDSRSAVFDVSLFVTTGLLGVILFLLWFATDHQATANNYNLLWALPTHLIVAFFLSRPKLPSWVAPYMLLTAVIAAALVIFWPWWPQQFHASFLPITLALGVRATYILWFSKKVGHKVVSQKIN